MQADGKIIIETEVNSDEVDKWLNNLPKNTKEKLDQTQKQIESLSQNYGELAQKYLELTNPTKGTPIFKSDAEEAKKLKKELQDVARELERITGDKIVSIKGITDLNEETTKYSKNTVSNFKEMASTIKKFGLSLIGLRSIYAVVSRASSAYLSQDTELAEKLRSVWVGLGSFLAPVLEMISNSLLKALGYLNVFIKALTGIDYLARANAKALKSQASAQKELNKQTYDFDVIRTQKDTSSSGGGISSNGLFEIPELDENIVKKLQEMANWLKTNWKWLKKVGEILLITFGTVKIAKVLSGIASLLGGDKTGLIGLSSVLSGLLQVGVVTLGVYLLYTAMTGRDLIQDLKDIKDGIKEVTEMTEKNTKAEEEHKEQIKDYNKQIKEKIENGKLDEEQLKKYTNFLKNNSTATSNQIRLIQSNTIVTGKMREEQKVLSDQLGETLSAYEYLYDQGLLNEDETKDYIQVLSEQIGIMEELGYDTDDLKQKYQNLTGQEWNVRLTATDYASSTLDKITRKILELLNLPTEITIKTNTSSSGFGHGGGGGRHFALGGIVTQPTRALIGEAGYPEAVVPMTQDYLSTLASEIARFGSSGKSGTVNVYLDGRLIQRQVANVQNQKNFATNR